MALISDFKNEYEGDYEFEFIILMIFVKIPRIIFKVLHLDIL
jgi:hypothetical protein